MDRTPLNDAVDGWLADGPLSLEELAARAVKAGLLSADVDDEGFEPEDQIADLLDMSDAYWTRQTDADDEVVVLASTFVETGMTFTHRVTADELDAGAVDEMPDLSVLLWNVEDGLPLDDGTGRVTVDFTEITAPRLVGPENWLGAAGRGDLLAFSRTDGVLSVEVIEDEDGIGDGGAESEALHDAALRWIGDGHGEDEVPLVMDAMAGNQSLFREPVPPIGELLGVAGLENRGPEWGWVGEQWLTRQERYRNNSYTSIGQLYRFDLCCDRAFARVADAFTAYLTAGEVDNGRALADDLAHGSVAAAFVYANRTAPEVVAGFARVAAASASGRHTAPAQALLGLVSLSACDPVQAVEALEDALRADPDLEIAAGALAELELDRGNLSRAHSLAVRGAADPTMVDGIEKERARRAALQPSAGRNDPCPCGSGRKFKKCCAGGVALPLTERVSLMLVRLSHFAASPEGHSTMVALALSAADGHDDLAEGVIRFVREPFLLDISIHEGGLGERYADQRRLLLPDDEAALLDAVLDEPRRLWEITEGTPGESTTLRDTGSGDVVTVAELSGKPRQPGELMLARVTTVDGAAMLLGVPVIVPLRERARMLHLLDGSLDAEDLAMWFGSQSLPPRLTNRDGDEMALRRTACEVADDHDTVVAVLDGVYERQDDELVWHETAVADGHDTVIRGTLRFDGPLLVVESNSHERQDRILSTIGELFDLAIVDDAELDAFHLDLDEEDPDGGGPLDVEDMPDEMKAVLESTIAGYERRWVDESIPALDGITPREALDDPTRREDLFALLREMRSLTPPEGAVGMSVDRLERLLGIDHD